MDDESPTPLEETRPPSVEDLARLANSLNELGAKYIVIGGFAIIAAGYTRATMDNGYSNHPYTVLPQRKMGLRVNS